MFYRKQSLGDPVLYSSTYCDFDIGCWKRIILLVLRFTDCSVFLWRLTELLYSLMMPSIQRSKSSLREIRLCSYIWQNQVATVVYAVLGQLIIIRILGIISLPTFNTLDVNKNHSINKLLILPSLALSSLSVDRVKKLSEIAPFYRC